MGEYNSIITHFLFKIVLASDKTGMDSDSFTTFVKSSKGIKTFSYTEVNSFKFCEFVTHNSRGEMGSLHSSPDFCYPVILLSDIAANGGTVITDSGVVTVGEGCGGIANEIFHCLIFHTDKTATLPIESHNDIGVIGEVLKEFGLEFHELANEGRGRVKDFGSHVVSEGHSGIATANKISNGFHGDIISGDVSDITSYGIDGHLTFSVVCCFFPYCLNIG
jgi:hypothetical protein